MSSIESNREAQRSLIATLLRNQFATDTERAELNRLAKLVESSGPYKLLKVSNSIYRISRKIGTRRDAYRPLNIVC